MRAMVDNDKNLIAWEYQTSGAEGGKVTFDLDEIVQFKFFNPYDKYVGLSPLKALMFTIETDQEARRFNKSVLTKGSPPGGVLETEMDLTDEQIKRMRKQWEENHKGGDKAGKVGILYNGLKYKALQLSQADAAYIEQRKLGKEEIHAVYDVPMALTGDSAKETTRANLSEIKKAWWTEVLIPELMNFETNLKTNFFDKFYPGYYGMFDLTVIPELQIDINKIAETAERLNKLGFTAEEINKRLDMGFENNKTWRRRWYQPISMVPVDGQVEKPKKEKDDAKELKDKLNKAQKNIEAAEKEMSIRHYKIWKTFTNITGPIEREYRSKVGRYMFELRKEILGNLYGFLEDYVPKKGPKPKTKVQDAHVELFNLTQQQKKLIALSTPYFEEAFIKAGQQALNDVGSDIVFDIVNDPSIRFINLRKNKIKDVTETVYKEVQAELSDGIAAGSTGDEIAEGIRHKLTVAEGRSKLIARTEINGCANGGRFNAYQENGFELHTWVNSFDPDVREEHNFSQTVKLGKEFQNGLKFPGDQTGSQSTAKNLCNCRCTTIAEVE